jgi:DNA-binding transcriptional regulator GbsR (MarR family)
MTQAEVDPIAEFIELMGLLAQEEHAPRISGRIMGLMVAEAGPHGLQEMADRLQVSKASISTNVRMLHDRGVLRRAARPGDRQDYYELLPHPYTTMLDTAAQKMRKHAELIAEAGARIPQESTQVRERINGLADFYNQAADFMATWRKNMPSRNAAAM